jgi:hypothetical protein
MARTFDYDSGIRVLLETRYGKVQATFNDAEHAFVIVQDENGQGYINTDSAALTFRNQEYIGSVHLYLSPTGWSAPNGSHFSKRPQWTDAPKTHAQALEAACIEAVLTYVASNPDVLDRGERSALARDLHSAIRDADEMREKLAALDAQIAEQTARYDEITAELGE